MRRFEGGGGPLGLVAGEAPLRLFILRLLSSAYNVYGGRGIHTALGELEPPRAARCVWAYPGASANICFLRVRSRWGQGYRYARGERASVRA